MLRIATMDDFKFIYKVFLREARLRHFNHAIYTSLVKRFGFRCELRKIIKHGSRISNGEKSTAFVFTNKNKPVGFTIISFDELNECIELWLVAIDENFRGRGFGKEMTRQVLEVLSPRGIDIYARCYNHSEAMTGILTRYNFKIDPRFTHPEMKLLLLLSR